MKYLYSLLLVTFSISICTGQEPLPSSNSPSPHENTAGDSAPPGLADDVQFFYMGSNIVLTEKEFEEKTRKNEIPYYVK